MKFKTVLLLGLILAFGSLCADEYTIDRVSISATIQQDGTIDYTEERTYTFDGEFSWATYTLPKNGFTEITNISIQDQSGQYSHINSEEPGTFKITTNDQEINFKWFYAAQNETKTFTIRYTLHGALAVGHTWTEFFWNYISDSWKEPTEEARITVEIPGIISEDSLHTWLRTDIQSANVAMRTNGFILTARDIGDDQNLLCRFLFPTSVLNNIPVTAEKLTLTSAQQEETDYRQKQIAQAERDAKQAVWGKFLSIAIAVLSLILWLYFFFQNGRRHKIRGVPEFLYDLPSEEKPAIIGWLIQSRSINGSHLIASIFDLAQRNFFTIHQEDAEKSFLKKEEYRFRLEKNLDVTPEMRSTLTEWENALYEFVVDAMEDEFIYLDALTDQRSAIRKWFPKWSKQVKEDAKSRHWIDSSSKRAAMFHLGLQVLLFLGGIISILWGDMFGLIGTFTAFFFAILSVAIVRRTEQGEKVYQQWKALKRSIEKMPENNFARDHIDTLFIHAIALGLSEKKLKNWLQQVDLQTQQIAWIAFIPAVSSAASVAHAVTAMAGTGLTTVSSVAGGAGASAGAAGGGAGGSAG